MGVGVSTELACTETLPVGPSQTAVFTGLLAASPSFWAFDGQGHSSLGFLTCSN